MLRSPQRNTPKRAPARIAPRRTPPSGRLARPGRPPRRSGANGVPLLALAGLVLILVVGAYLVWQTGRTRSDAEASLPATVDDAYTPAAELSLTAGHTATPGPTPTNTPPVVSSGAVPGGQVTPAPATATRSTPAAQATEPLAGSTATGVSTVPAEPVATRQANLPAAPTIAASAAETAAPRLTEPNFQALQQQMLQRVNADRTANGLNPVEWDETAARAGQLHAEEMALFGYMSHWNMGGYGPEYRYSRAGGLNYSQENVYRLVHTWQDGGGAPIDDWEQVIEDAEAALMNSPGHRANILAPEHTHLGVGIAYNSVTGNVTIAQEFINRYVTTEPVARRAEGGDRIVLRGNLLDGSRNPLVNVAYEPFPSPMSLDELNRTSTYTPAAKHLAVPPVVVGSDSRFVAEFTLDKDAQPGLYHVLLWVETDGAAERVPSVDAIIEVSE
jgi:uncharacterized protein YkwD